MADQEKDSAHGELLQKMRGLQNRLEGTVVPLPAKASDLYIELQQVLFRAVWADVLETPDHCVGKIMKLKKARESRKVFERGGTHGIVGGPKDIHRLETDIQPEKRFVRREDGAVIHFTITVKEEADKLVLLAYDFELYFPSKEPIWFVRFDLNPLDHKNDTERAMRSHLHPSHENLQVPSAILSPSEALSLLLYGLRIDRDAPRGPSQNDTFSNLTTGSSP